MIYYIPKPSQSQVHTTSCASELDTSPPAIGPVPIVHTVCQVHADFEHLPEGRASNLGWRDWQDSKG